MNKSRYNTIYLSSWWLCIVTLPWTIPFNSFSLVALAVVCLAEGNFITKWERLKNNTWAWSFLFFFVVHILGLLYTQDSPAGLFEIEKKLGFLAIPLVAASGPLFSESSFNLLKKSFIYSCLLVVVISLAYTGYSLLGNEAPLIQNFDLQTNQHFHDLNPGASGLWEYFSYIQLGEWIDIHPAYFSMYLIFCIAILVNQMMECRIINARDLSIIILFTFFIVLLSSRMAIVSLTLVMLYFLFHYLKRNLNRKVILLTGLFFVLLFALPGDAEIRIHRRWNPDETAGAVKIPSLPIDPARAVSNTPGNRAMQSASAKVASVPIQLVFGGQLEHRFAGRHIIKDPVLIGRARHVEILRDIRQVARRIHSTLHIHDQVLAIVVEHL